MNEFTIGGFAVSTAGHDTGKCYVIFQMDSEYVYLVDGRIRTLDHPKKKKRMHVKMPEMLKHSSTFALSVQELADKVRNNTVKNEEIKRAIKLLLQYTNSSKEAENV